MLIISNVGHFQLPFIPTVKKEDFQISAPDIQNYEIWSKLVIAGICSSLHTLLSPIDMK